jgi:hypothetical protein
MPKSESDGSVLGTPGNKSHLQECMEQAMILWAQYQDTWDEKLLNQIIEFGREALRLRPEGHPDRHLSCGNLAGSLRTQYDCTGDEYLLTEAIDLDREALRLCPEGHPDRHLSCGNLAISLRTQYYRKGDENLCTEAIDLDRESLRLRPEGHLLRHLSCGNLAGSLLTQYDRTGDENLLTEAIDLDREALRLSPEGHPDQHHYCGNLAGSLLTQYNRTGDENLLIEAIDLDRETLRLRPEGHPYRHHSCGNLALSLWTLYNCTKNETLLTESIDLDREALRLRPEGHPDRHLSFGNLASSLRNQYDHTEDRNLLTEAVDLEYEALRLRPEGHPDRYLSCGNLAGSLLTQYDRTRDEAFLVETISLTQKAAALAPAHEKWHYTIKLSSIHLMQQTPHYSITLATQYLSQCLEDMPDNLSRLIFQALVILDKLWVESLETIFHTSLKLAPIYRQIIVLLPLLCSPAFDLASQFQRLRNVRQVGVDASINAVLAGNWCAGLEHLEVAQGLIWAQRLHQRDSQFPNIPEAQKAELELCLRAFSRHNAVPARLSLEHPSRLSRDDLHRYSARMYAVIHQIRTVPGLERFMLGESCATLCRVTTHHPAVVLVGARGHFYAFIIAFGQVCGDEPLKLDLTDSLLNISSVYGQLSSQRGSSDSNIVERHERAMQVGRSSTLLDYYLQSLWLRVVKPVLNVLQLKVCMYC